MRIRRVALPNGEPVADAVVYDADPRLDLGQLNTPVPSSSAAA
jgi:hypothetical protein